MRILIYSHDTFGLGHLRRSQTIAHAIVRQFAKASVLIVSGSPLIGQFRFEQGVDFVRIPGVLKNADGDYTAASLNQAVDETIALRRAIISRTAQTFRPDIAIVDKEPWGLRGELSDTLEALASNGCHLILGLRDVLDDPLLLRAEWARKHVAPALTDLYNTIWVYGREEIYNPFHGLDLGTEIESKVQFVGYLRRSVQSATPPQRLRPIMDRRYLLAVVGGGGDGARMIDWLLAAYEYEKPPNAKIHIVFGPFMAQADRNRLTARAAKLASVTTLTFDTQIEHLMQNAQGIIAMGGYNTFCEILSFKRPALIVPRLSPRREQLIRAQRANDLGLIRTMTETEIEERSPETMADAIRALQTQPPPEKELTDSLLMGLDGITANLSSFDIRRNRFAIPS